MLKLFNTLSRDKELFQPIKAGQVALYVCGVTVYDQCHLGHARTYLSADLLVRFLRYSGFDVNYVRNITDIDDKIIKRAQEKQETITQLTDRTIDAMHADFNDLGLIPASHEPRATAFIPQMIHLIEKLIAQESAYVASNGDVYFAVRKFPQYGCLSHHDIDQLESGARIDINDVKQDPLDFVLWKLAKADEPAWDSPWGKGRPGWHIECSAMAMELLGETFDIHGGGRDLIFPHHENEIAQSMAASHKDFARYWFHGGFLQVDNEKMSKSLGNFVTIRSALQQYGAETLRYFFVASHYRSPIVYSDDALSQAKQSLTRLYTALRFLPNTAAAKNTVYEAKFLAAMQDDLNTPLAMAALFELAHEIQRQRSIDNSHAAALATLLKNLAGVLGLLQLDVESYFQGENTAQVQQIEDLIAARDAARKNKQWAEADALRQQLLDMGVAIEDSVQGTSWKLI